MNFAKFLRIPFIAAWNDYRKPPVAASVASKMNLLYSYVINMLKCVNE